MHVHDDPALDALFLPFDEGHLAPSSDTAFLGARDGAAFRRWARDGFVLEQDFRPGAQALEQAGGWPVLPELDVAPRFSCVLVLPPRQREQARARLARAMALLAPGGRLVAAAANNAGARSLQSDLEQLAGPVSVASKYKCRVMWTAPFEAPADTGLHAHWLTLDAPRRTLDGQWWSRPGLFAWDRVDPASALLARRLPTNLQGSVADLGAGWGYLSAILLDRNPGVTRLEAFEALHGALVPLERNLAQFESRVAIGRHWHDVTAGIPGMFDAIVSNPPFHTDDRRDRPELGQRFIAVASAALRPGGRFFMVANRHLPYEETLRKVFGDVRVLDQGGGFKAFEAIR